MKFPRPSPSIFAYCKRSKTGGIEGLGTRLHSIPPHLVYRQCWHGCCSCMPGWCSPWAKCGHPISGGFSVGSCINVKESSWKSALNIRRTFFSHHQGRSEPGQRNGAPPPPGLFDCIDWKARREGQSTPTFCPLTMCTLSSVCLQMLTIFTSTLMMMTGSIHAKCCSNPNPKHELWHE